MEPRICCLQMRHDGPLRANLERAAETTRAAVEEGADVVVLPEYFFGPTDDADAPTAVRSFFETTSAEVPAILAGNVVQPRADALANVGLVYRDGEPILEQVKLQPMPHEQRRGIRGGDDVAVVRVEDLGLTLGVVVCADILFPSIARDAAEAGADVLLNPVMSPYRAHDPTREAREAMYIARAWDNAVFVAKAAGIRDDDAVGRSLVASPWGLVARYDDERTEQRLHADLDMEALAGVRKDRERFPTRRER